MAYEHDVLDAVHDVVLIVSADGSIHDANAAAEAAYGLSRDALVALNIVDLRAEGSRAELAEQLVHASQAGVTFETVHLRGDGTPFPVEVSASPIEINGSAGVVSVVRDITRRRENEELRIRLVEQLSETNARLDGALTLLTGAVGAADLNSLLESTVTALSSLMGADAALFVTDEGERFRVRAQFGADDWAPVGSGIDRGQGLCGRVAEAGAPLYVADILSSSALRPEHTGAGLRSMFGVPVYVDGDLFGVVECGWTEERQVGQTETAMVQLAAERMSLAIARARLFERSRRGEQLNASLNRITAVLNASLELDRAIDEALRMAADVLGCDVAIFADAESGGWRLDHAVGLDVLADGLSVGHTAVTAAADFPDVSERVSDGHAAWMAEHFGLGQTLVAPVPVRRGVAGALLFGRRDPQERFDDQALDFVRRLAQSLALAVSNAEHFRVEHHIADTLQEALLLMPPSVKGMEFAHLYRSATLSTRVGGDFFDVFEMVDDRVGLLVGDVSGKGLEAAVLTSIIKDTIRAYAHETASPAEAIARANMVLGEAAKLPDFASVFFAVVDCRSGVMSYCNAGHPPAAIIAADGSVRLLEGTSPVIGAFPDLEYWDRIVELGLDETVLLYTDGVTEARNPDGAFFGEEGLVLALSSAIPADVSELPSAVFESVLGFAEHHLTDDIALLAFRRAQGLEAASRALD